MSPTTLDKPQNIGFLWSTMSKEERKLLLQVIQNYKQFRNITMAELPFLPYSDVQKVIDLAPTSYFEDKSLRAKFEHDNSDRWSNPDFAWKTERRLWSEASAAKKNIRKLFEPSPFWKLKGIDPS